MKTEEIDIPETLEEKRLYSLELLEKTGANGRGSQPPFPLLGAGPARSFQRGRKTFFRMGVQS